MITYSLSVKFFDTCASRGCGFQYLTNPVNITDIPFLKKKSVLLSFDWLIGENDYLTSRFAGELFDCPQLCAI